MWIGNSLLFNWLDRNLRPIEPPPEGSLGKIWLLHSGAFYEVEKKLLPANTPYPDKVHWFMFQNLTTWVSGIPTQSSFARTTRRTRSKSGWSW